MLAFLPLCKLMSRECLLHTLIVNKFKLNALIDLICNLVFVYFAQKRDEECAREMILEYDMEICERIYLLIFQSSIV